jgi:hypothetical protein
MEDEKMAESDLLGLPGPELEPDPEPEPQAAAGTSRRTRRRATPSIEDCLYQLSQLPGLIATGLLTSAQANAISRALTAILAYHAQAQASTPSGAQLDVDLRARLRDDPQLMHMLEPLLSDEQISLLMGAS